MLPPIIVLIGACLVAWGAHEPLVNIPVLGDVYLFNLGRAVAWTFCVLSVLTVLLVWLRNRALALTALVAALVALTVSMRDLVAKVTEIKIAGTVANVESVLRDSHALSGIVFLGGGLLIQLLGIMFRSQPPAQKR